MLWSAPLQVTVEISPAGAARAFRLSRRIELPPRLAFALPLASEAAELVGQLRFALPDGPLVEARATLRQDPERPERGLEAELEGLRPEAVAAIQRYIEERNLA
jgi:hypothetical protein